MAGKSEITKESFINRLIILVGMAMIFYAILIIRLLQIQIIDRQYYIEKAKKQYLAEAELPSDRGLIYDRNLEPLAVNRHSYSVGVDATKIDNPKFAASHFSVLFGKSREEWLKKIEDKTSFFWLSRRIGKEKKAILESLRIPGVIIRKEPIRFYPKGEIASQIVGFTDIDMKGLNGIELIKNWELTGNNGLAHYTRDAKGNRIIDINQPIKKPEKGNDVVLTINSTVQWIVEEELKYAVEKFEADAGVVLVTNPATGEILACGIIPTFNLNQASSSALEYCRNRAISDVYEPGSTIKSLVMAAVIEKGIKEPDDPVYCENGKYQIYDRTLEDVSPYGWLSVAKIVNKSSNIGMAKIAMEIEPQLIYEYLRDFGFGLETGISLPGEASGELKKCTTWSSYTPIAMSIGYEISVTPLQMAMAYGAIANGGLLLKPIICMEEANRVDTKNYRARPEVIRRVISKATAKTLINMLEEVVYDGTGKGAFIKGLRIAGKTGTSMKYDPDLKKYVKDKFVSSFIGFFPAEAPQMLIYVMIDNPRHDHLGGKVAAPIFKKILQRVLRLVDVLPKSDIYYATHKNSDDGETRNLPHESSGFPNLIGKKVDAAQAIAQQLGLALVIENSGEVIAKQRLVFEPQKHKKTQLIVTLKKLVENHGEYTSVPKVKGLGLRDALSKMAQHRLRVVVEGSGRVVRQIPEAGSKMRAGARCVIQCEPGLNLAHFSGG